MKNFILWIMWVPLRKLAFYISDKKLAQFGTVSGCLAYIFLWKRKSILKEEYSQMFPEKSGSEINKIILNYFILRSLIEIEETLCTQINKDNIEHIIKITNQEYLDATLSFGKGVILATFHFGPHLQIMPALGFRGFKVNQVAVKWKGDRREQAVERPPGFFATKLHKKRLEVSGNHFPTNVIPLDKKSSPRPLFRHLKNNEILIIALDGSEVGNTLGLPFYHHASYRFAGGPVNLALHTGAAIHPVFVIKHKNGHNELVIEKKIEIDAMEETKDTIKHNTEKIVKILKKHVEQYPCHYGNHMYHEINVLDSFREHQR